MTLEASLADNPRELARDAVGLPHVIFVSMTTMAPAAGAAFSITVGAYFAGGALPLAVIVALLGCAFTAMSIGQMARHLPSAGGMYTYIAKGLGGQVGFLTGWGFNLAYPLVVPLVVVLFGDLLGSTLHQEFGLSFTAWWIIGSVVCAVGVGAVNYFGIQASTRFGVILGTFEFLVMVALAITLIASAKHNSLSLLGLKYANVKGFHGVSGIIAGSVYGVLAFIGFDAAATLAEESRAPRSTVGKAAVGAAVIVGIFYVFTTYAAAAWFGPGRFSAFPGAGDGNPWNLMANAVWGVGWVVLFIALLNSSAACANGGACAATRCMWAMGRIGALPSVLGRTHRKWKSPHIAVLVVFAVGIVLTIWLGLQYTPITAFALIGTIITGAILPIYILVNVACIAYFWREHRPEFNIIKHGLVPLLGIVLFVPGFFAALGIQVFSFVGALTYPLNLAAYVIVAWYALGVILAIYYAVKHPHRITDTAKVFFQDALSDTGTPHLPHQGGPDDFDTTLSGPSGT